MPRPTTKDDLLTLGQTQFEKLMKGVSALPPALREAELDLNGRDRNVRDVLCHLEAWHRLVEGWYAEGRQGKDPVVPAPGYTWRTIPAMNREIWKDCQETPLSEAMTALTASHGRVRSLIEGCSNEELFGRSVYRWTKSTTLGAYFVSATSSHYDWAWKTLRPLTKGGPLPR